MMGVLMILALLVLLACIVGVFVIGFRVTTLYPDPGDPRRNEKRYTAPAIWLALLGASAVLVFAGALLVTLTTS